MLGDAKQESTIRTLGQTLLQFVPRDFELSLSTLVPEAIQAHVLHQDVEAVDEGASGGSQTRSICVCRENTWLLEFGLPRKRNAEPKSSHVTEVIDVNRSMREPGNAKKS